MRSAERNGGNGEEKAAFSKPNGLKCAGVIQNGNSLGRSRTGSCCMCMVVRTSLGVWMSTGIRSRGMQESWRQEFLHGKYHLPMRGMCKDANRSIVSLFAPNFFLS